MKSLLLGASILLTSPVLFSQNNAKNSKPTILSVNLSSRRTIIFNSAQESLNFKNPSANDSIITKTIITDKPAHLYYINIVVTPTGEKRESGNLLLLPGDSTVIQRNGSSIAYSTGFQSYTDSFVKIPDLCFFFTNPTKIVDSIGLRAMLSEIKQNYLANEERLSTLRIQPVQIQFLRDFNYLVQARAVCAIPFDKVRGNEILLLDSAYQDMLAHKNILDSIESPFSDLIYTNFIAYNTFKKGTYTNDFWTYFDKADSNMLTSSFYQPFILNSIKNTYKNLPDRLPFIAKELKTAFPRLRFFDTLSYIVNILLTTRTNYTAAKEKLNQYASGRYSFILDETDVLHRQQRNIQSLAEVNLIDFSKRKRSLQKIVAATKTKIVVLDFWASWCVPCVADYPFLKKIETSLKDRSVQFISISIDVEEDEDKWVSRTKQLKTFNMPYQYRLEDPKQSPVNSFFNLYSVPRYMVIDKKGNILEEDFDRPDEAGFQRKLESYLRNYRSHLEF